ncbi:MAG: HAD-IB family hydrolase [Deltaproteobacteria bacterium]|nr:HAD-IB family hydrolase [Deltaproteobacteria bacterium]
MALYSSLTGAIDKGPGGAQIAAFFDLDRTLIAGFSATAFVRELVRVGKLDAAALAQGMATATRFQLGGLGFSGFVTETLGALKGMAESELVEMGERLFTSTLATAIYPESRALVHAHQKKGHTVAVVSSALPYQVMPVARELGIEHVMCTRLEIADGALTGNVVHPTCYGVGKATAARDFAAPRGIKMDKSFFYTDSDEDLPLLDLVGRPRPINPNRNLAALAAKRGWPARRFTSRGTPTAGEIARTALAVASAVPASMLSVPAALLAGGWRAGVNLAVSTWGELGTALAGVDLQVQGEQYLWSHRPAVFIFNHQSAVEMLLLCKLLRRDFVGIAKKELEKNPIFGPIFAASGTIFVDRFNHEQAVHALEPAIAALRQGTSIVIAPEGTRSPTPTLGKFKKGAFHLAMAAGRPLVPIVFKNTLDVLPKYGVVLRPATVEVVVHKPIATASWKRKDLDKHVDEVRRLFESTLAA